METYIEHTYLKPEGAEAEVRRLCAEALQGGLFGVCVQPAYVRAARAELGESGVRLVAVVGFPHGANLSEVKAFEAERAVADGADELDMVANLGWAAAGEWRRVERDVAAVVAAARGRPVKVILETGLLADEARVRAAARAALAGGAAFLKTSTGFGPGGATVEHVRWLREEAGSRAGVKAAGGIRTAAQALALIAAGADRLGTSRGLDLVREWRAAGSPAPSAPGSG
ncbi:MAG: deoxyribose-phosphate aldolase [Firmicutes bacterium]|nr:deoxyribose-phosphate aldolase [Bacillota bacterium]